MFLIWISNVSFHPAIARKSLHQLFDEQYCQFLEVLIFCQYLIYLFE